jgi:serine/threonine protein kinase/tetratricopeptide (TPR) repeat protein
MIGRAISHYEILERIGEGAMSVVYKARDVRLGRFVALKFLHFQLCVEEEGKQRFLHEARAVSALDHPNICTIYDIDEAESGQLFIVMAYYRGENITQKIAGGPMPLRDALDIAIQSAQGLAKSHKEGIIHRDIKPANIMVTQEGIVKVLDFGVAKLVNLRITPAGATLGTPAYMSPEQILSKPNVDHRSDIWSLGVVLYEMLSGQLPFQQQYPQALQYSILSDPPESLRKLRADLPEELEHIITVKALAKDPDERYQSVDELLVDLRALQRMLPAGTTTTSTGKRPPRPTWDRKLGPRGRRVAWAAAVTFVLALLFPLAGQRLFGERCLWAPAWFTACQVPVDKHVSMLSFENLGGDPASQAFGDGLVQSFTSKLTKLASFHDSLCVHPPRSDQQVFGGGLALSGTVERTGTTVRLNLKLSNAQSGLPLRALATENDILDVNAVSALQDRLVEQMAALMEIEFPAQARVALAAGGTTIPGAFESYIEGLGYLGRDDIDNAESRFQQALASDQYYALAQIALGDVYRRRYELTKQQPWADQARQNCLKAIEHNDQLDGAYLTLGRVYSRTGQGDQAVVAFRRALDLNPLDFDTQRELANAYIATVAVQEAESVYLQAIESRRNCWRASNRLGVFYDGYGRYDEAEKQFRKVIEVAPKSPIGYTNLGLLYIKIERDQEAAKMLETSLQIQELPRTYLNLGVAYFHQGCYADAARTMVKAVDLGLNDYRTWGDLAEAYLMVPELADRAPGAFRQAIALAEEETAKSPADAEGRSLLANYYARLRDNEKALAAISDALRLGPNNVNVLFQAALVHEMAGQRDRALETLEAALRAGYSLKEVRQSEPLKPLRSDPRYQELDEVGYNLQTNPQAAEAERTVACPSTPPGPK